MSNNFKKVVTISAALLFSLSPALTLVGKASTESQVFTEPDSPHSMRNHGSHPGKDGKFRAGGHFIIIETARLLEMERSELVNSLKSGKSLTELAKEKKGWSEDQYIQKLSESASRKLDQAISEGRLTEDEAKKMKAGLPAILKQRIGKIGHFQEGKPAEQPTKAP